MQPLQSLTQRLKFCYFNYILTKNVIYYKSIDTAGEPIILSGYFEYPVDTNINQIVLSVHGTIQTNTQAPSATKSAGGLGANSEKGRVYIAAEINAMD